MLRLHQKRAAPTKQEIDRLFAVETKSAPTQVMGLTPDRLARLKIEVEKRRQFEASRDHHELAGIETLRDHHKLLAAPSPLSGQRTRPWPENETRGANCGYAGACPVKMPREWQIGSLAGNVEPQGRPLRGAQHHGPMVGPPHIMGLTPAPPHHQRRLSWQWGRISASANK